MCDELACRISGCSERTGKLVAQDNLETTVIPTELTTTINSPRTDDNVQGNMLQNYAQNLRKSSRTSSFDQTMLHCRYHEDRGEEAVFSRPSTMRNWTTLEAHVESIPYLETTQHQKGWIRGNMKIGPALEVAVSQSS